MNEDKFHTFLNFCAAIVILACFIGVVIKACQCFKSVPPQTHKIVLTVSPDSVYDDAKFTYYTDSLINIINKHEHVIADRYEALLEDKADTQKYWSLAGVLVSFILGVAGFFGFKSIKDIERGCKKNAISIATSKASEIATTIARNKTREYLDKNLKKEIKESSDIYLGDQEKYICEMVKTEVAKAAQDGSDRLEYLADQLKDVEDRIDSMEKTNAATDSASENSQTEEPPANSENDLFG